MAEIAKPETTATFLKSASTSIFNTLPAELATYIFDLATLNCRPNAANCRLVCQDFYTYSSPFLVRTIVIASRLEALLKAREILLHPYFRVHVTHLLWDGSFYEEILAHGFDNYVSAVNKAEHDTDHRYDAFCRSTRNDNMLEAQLRRDRSRALSIPATLCSGGSLLNYGVPVPAAEERVGSMSQQPQEFPSEEDIPELARHETAIKMDCYSTFPNYVRGWWNQMDVASSEAKSWQVTSGEQGVDGDLCQHYFLRAIDELPKLKHISYGDYRSLAYEGESYTELVNRLFGQTLPPTCDNAYITDDDVESSCLKDFLKELAKRRRVWHSLSIGRHPFERSLVDRATRLDYGWVPENMEIEMEFREMLIGNSTSDLAKLQVKSLYMPSFTKYPSTDDSLCSLTTFFEQDCLVDLDLGYDFFEEYLKGEIMSPPKHDPMLGILIEGLHNLRSISLRGFSFDMPTLQQVLSSHAATLRTLRLIDCYFTHSYHIFETFVKDRTPTMALTGVEIYGLHFDDPALHGRSSSESLDYEPYQAMRDDKRFPSLEAIEKRGQLEKIDMVASWPYERFELEAAMLGGRVNTVARRRHNPPYGLAREEWWNLPASYR